MKFQEKSSGFFIFHFCPEDPIFLKKNFFLFLSYSFWISYPIQNMINDIKIEI
jgi:hypothetical protein